MDEIKERDYSELEGKIIDIEGIKSCSKGKVIGCDPDIGITIVDLDDPNHYLVCLVGPSSPNHSGKYIEENRKMFDMMVEQIEHGSYDMIASRRTFDELTGSPSLLSSPPSAKKCAFNQ